MTQLPTRRTRRDRSDRSDRSDHRLRRAHVAALAAGLVAVMTAGVLAAPAVPAAPPVVGAVGAVAPQSVRHAAQCDVGSKVTAKQVVVVRARGSAATVTACRRTAAGAYVVALGPFQGHVGRNGVARPGTKREGDGRTPAGVFPLRGGFGVYANPGVAFPYFRTDGRDRWVDDPTSRFYNLHKRSPANGRWSSAERLRISPAYDYAQVIGYNEARVPYRGSAIFLHRDTGGATAGCVSLKRKALLKILRWQERGAQISIRRASSSASLIAPAAVSPPPYFSSSRRATKADVPHSWRPGCPVPPRKLRVLRIRYWGFDRQAHVGTLVVNRRIAPEVREAFGVLYAKRFAINKMRPVDAYDANDRRSMRADNTSGFNCRFVSGTTNWSNHAYGLAMDINPVENPWVSGGNVRPRSGAAYLDRSDRRKGMLVGGTAAVRAFTSRGFTWGGYWYEPDYQHVDLR